MDRRLAWWLAGPAILIIGFTVIYPLVYSLVISLQKYDLARPNERAFIGLENYVRILMTDERFWSSLSVTAYFVFLAVLLEVGGGLMWAMLLNQKFKGRGLARTLALLPWAVPPVVNAIMWKWIYNPKYGALNGLLMELGLIKQEIIWLGSPFLALNMTVLADAWKETPFIMLLILAALQTVPKDVYEAARVDGANRWQTFWNVTIPLIRPMLFIALTLRTIWALKTFDLIFTLTAGGPSDGTTLLTFYNYKIAFTSLRMGYGSAVAWLITLIILVFVMLYTRYVYREVEY